MKNIIKYTVGSPILIVISIGIIIFCGIFNILNFLALFAELIIKGKATYSNYGYDILLELKELWKPIN